MIEATEISLQRAEGPSPLPPPVVIMGAGVWGIARHQLQLWSATAPGVTARIGSDKTDFTVTFEDGQTYNGCFMLQAGGSCDLAEHIRAFARRANELAETSKARGSDWYVEEAAVYSEFLAHYKVGD